MSQYRNLPLEQLAKGIGASMQQARKSMTRSFSISMLISGVLALRLCLLFGSPAYMPDSANYIEQARGLLAGKGFEARLPDADGLHIHSAPDGLFPPGYPILIGGTAAAFGKPIEIVAPWINRIALLLLPLTVFAAFRSVAGDCRAALLGILGSLSPGVLFWGQYALTDVISLSFTIATIGIMLKAWEMQGDRRANYFAVLAGLFAGYAYLIRNAQLALLLASFASAIFWYIIAPAQQKKEKSHLLLSWTGGAAVVVAPWLIRNLLVFGKFQPYYMPPSTINAWTNIRSFIAALVSEASGSPYFGKQIGWSLPGLIAAGIIVAIAAKYVFDRRSLLSPLEQKAISFSCIYLVLGSGIVIAARTKYQWGEGISSRHTLQYAIFTLLIITILLQKTKFFSSNATVMFGICFLALVGMRADSLRHDLWDSNGLATKWRTRSTVAHQIEYYKSSMSSPCSDRGNALVISNYDYLYRAICDVDALKAEHYPGGPIPEFAASMRSKIVDKRIIVALHTDNRMPSLSLPLESGDPKLLGSQGWIVEENSSSAVVLAAK
jgi:hypothetical protein